MESEDRMEIRFLRVLVLFLMGLFVIVAVQDIWIYERAHSVVQNQEQALLEAARRGFQCGLDPKLSSRGRCLEDLLASIEGEGHE